MMVCNSARSRNDVTRERKSWETAASKFVQSSIKFSKRDQMRLNALIVRRSEKITVPTIAMTRAKINWYDQVALRAGRSVVDLISWIFSAGRKAECWTWNVGSSLCHRLGDQRTVYNVCDHHHRIYYYRHRFDQSLGTPCSNQTKGDKAPTVNQSVDLGLQV